MSMGFPRQEYSSGLPLPSPGNLPEPGIELVSPALADRFFTTEPPGKPMIHYIYKNSVFSDKENVGHVSRRKQGFQYQNFAFNSQS